MTPEGLAALVVAVAAVLAFAFAGLTAVGERRRGGRLVVVVVAALFFPLAWVVWYSNDQRAGAVSARRT